MSARSRAGHDDDGTDTKPMYNMDAGTLEYFEELYGWGYYYDASGFSGNQERSFNARASIKNELTGEYVNRKTGERVKYMMYNIPAEASSDLKHYMENLKREYEPVVPMKRLRYHVNDLPDSIPSKNRARIIELRKKIEGFENNITERKILIESLERSQVESRDIEKSKQSIRVYEREIEGITSLIATTEEMIQRLETGH